MTRYSYQKLEELRAGAIALYESNPNLTSKEIAARLNIGVTAVCSYLKYVRRRRKTKGRL